MSESPKSLGEGRRPGWDTKQMLMVDGRQACRVDVRISGVEIRGPRASCADVGGRGTMAAEVGVDRPIWSGWTHH